MLSVTDLALFGCRQPSRQGSNPLMLGVPKRVPSLNTQVEGKCRELGGINAIHR